MTGGKYSDGGGGGNISTNQGCMANTKRVQSDGMGAYRKI